MTEFRITSHQISEWEEKFIRKGLYLGSTSLQRGWSNAATGCLERWSVPQAC